MIEIRKTVECKTPKTGRVHTKQHWGAHESLNSQNLIDFRFLVGVLKSKTLLSKRVSKLTWLSGSASLIGRAASSICKGKR
uniref:Uncharacterized protein n=1 Tax=Romanomermis culicivorax TaxID=13658 RepID=A0A915L290_ROMCU